MCTHLLWRKLEFLLEGFSRHRHTGALRHELCYRRMEICGVLHGHPSEIQAQASWCKRLVGGGQWWVNRGQFYWSALERVNGIDECGTLPWLTGMTCSQLRLGPPKQGAISTTVTASAVQTTRAQVGLLKRVCANYRSRIKIQPLGKSLTFRVMERARKYR